MEFLSKNEESLINGQILLEKNVFVSLLSLLTHRFSAIETSTS